LDDRFLLRDDFCRGASWLREFGFTCDISAYARQLPAAVDWNRWSPELFEPHLGIAFDALGADRLMFGSDWSACLLAGSYHRVGIGGRRFYGLKVRHGFTTQR
jgi:predicted TIM-barrel fold metal-dependent hydrolase